MSGAIVFTEDELNKRLDADIDTLLDNFTHIVEAATLRQSSRAHPEKYEIKDKFKIAQEQQLMQGAAANIVNACESLLTLTSELKQALVLNDFPMLNSIMYARWATAKEHEMACDSALLDFKKEIDVETAELEDALLNADT